MDPSLPPRRRRFTTFLRWARIAFLICLAMLPVPLVAFVANILRSDRRSVPTLSVRKKRSG
jgi:hypothetical protein